MNKNLEKGQAQKGMSFTIPYQATKETFLSTIREVESLREFYETFRDTWNTCKIEFASSHAVAIALDDFIKNLSNDLSIEEKYEKINSAVICGHKVTDIIQLILKEDTERNKTLYIMKPGFADQDPQKARNQMIKYEREREIFVRSILTNIVIIFENYLSRIFEFLVILNPKEYFEGKTVKILDLFSESIKSIIVKEVQEQVSGNMYNSLKTLDLMKSKSQVDIDRYLPIRKEFEEIYFRRNIFVHNSGIVNDIYLSQVDSKYTKNLKCGDPLVCDDLYIQNSIFVLGKMVCALMDEFLLSTKAAANYFEPLAEDVGFNALRDGDYGLAEYIYGILRKHRNFEFAAKTMYEINYMIALKQQGKSIDSLLKNFDVSAMHIQFVIAKACLMEDNARVYSLLSKAYPDDFPAPAIRDWPLFIDFRKSEEYRTFQEEHSEDFKKYSFEAVGKIEDSSNLPCNDDSSSL